MVGLMSGGYIRATTTHEKGTEKLDRGYRRDLAFWVYLIRAHLLSRVILVASKTVYYITSPAQASDRVPGPNQSPQVVRYIWLTPAVAVCDTQK